MDLYLIIVLLLFVLAISDLVVGVSNDAVNFLNSAIGSKVASRRTIMLVASLGIVAGATFSSGMMEVARKGIFNPQFFTFSEVMILFLAVMLTDIILLDLFNTFGMPTSTTVSIVFELLGASVALAAMKVAANGEGFGAITTYINSDSALAIISGIFLSVGIAFTIGALIQFLTRVLFSFNYQSRLRFVGVIWSGFALTAIGYFLLIKGLKGTPFVPTSFLVWTKANTVLLLLLTLAITTIMAYILHRMQINVLRIVVLAGTFALAMAFAGNDLVNFIGVPLAGLESYNTWVASGSAPENLMMVSLAQQYPAKTYMLLLAGLIMVTTLWFSRKSRSVTETEVNLGRQSEGLERFSSNRLSRGIVRFFTYLGSGSTDILPERARQQIQASFTPVEEELPETQKRDQPAFDLVRASVNLTVASVLIAIATSQRLPLSTTYVSFMVAMGTSLADRAWGRDSAVYRVAGVLNVIGGWFMTAFIAFTVAGIFAYLMSRFGLGAIVLLVALAIGLLYNTFRLHRKREKGKEKLLAAAKRTQEVPADKMIRDTAVGVVKGLTDVREGYQLAIQGLIHENMEQLLAASRALERLKAENETFKYTFYGAIKRIQERKAQASRAYLLVYDLQQDIIQSTELIIQSARGHVADVLLPLKPEQTQALQEVSVMTSDYLLRCAQTIQDWNFSDYTQLKADKHPIFMRLETLMAEQADGIKNEIYGARNSMLFFSLLLETKDLIAVAVRFVKLYYRLETQGSEEDPWGLLAKR